jgi:hypothetical protein
MTEVLSCRPSLIPSAPLASELTYNDVWNLCRHSKLLLLPAMMAVLSWRRSFDSLKAEVELTHY